MPRQTNTTRPAFTLVEVLMVVAILGIAGLVVVPRLLADGDMQLQAACRMVISDLLIAQNEAIARQEPVRVIFDSNLNQYRVVDDEGNLLYTRMKAGTPGTGNYIMDFSTDDRFSGSQITAADFTSNNWIEFDDLGSPNSGGSVDLVSGRFHYRIQVAPITGKITIEEIADGG